MGRRLQWFTITATQLAHVVDGCMKELSEDADRERAAKETVTKVAKEKAKAVEAAEKARAMAESRCAELLEELNEMDVKLAKAESLNTAQAEELGDMRAALEAAEEKWYQEGFADAENSVVQQAQKVGFEAGWLAALQATGVLTDSPLRNLGQIPFSVLAPTVQNPPAATDARDTTSFRELVEQIDAHMEADDAEVTSIPYPTDQQPTDQHPTERAAETGGD